MYHSRFMQNHYKAGFNWGSQLKKKGILLKDNHLIDYSKERIDFVKECLPIYQEYFPEILEEIRGIAEGQETEVEFLQTFLISMYCFEFNNHCSCFAYKEDDQIIFGRNSDFLTEIEQYYDASYYHLERSIPFVGHTTAFVEMEDGVNAHGLAVGLTFIYPLKRKPGFNAGMLVRLILEKCKTTQEAIELIDRVPIASAQTLTIIDRTGDMIIIESNPDKIIHIEPKQNYVATTNHFNSEEMKYYHKVGLDDWRSSERYQVLQDALKTHQGSFSMDFSKKLLSGAFGFMCQYDRKQGADTVWSVIYDLANFKIYRVEGNPSRKAFKEDKRLKFIQ